MKVHFIGAGPGDPDLITVRGKDIISNSPVCLYAGSLVPKEIIKFAPINSKVIDTSSMTLPEIITEIRLAQQENLDVARVHSGDPSLYGAIGEQMNELNKLGIDYDIVPGVPAFSAAAAALKMEFTIPGIVQTVILTRTSSKSSPMPAGEELSKLAETGATLAIHLSIRNLRAILRTLIPIYGISCPIIVAYRVGWPDQMMITDDLDGIYNKVRMAKITRTALILVGPGLNKNMDINSSLYNPDHKHLFRPK